MTLPTAGATEFQGRKTRQRGLLLCALLSCGLAGCASDKGLVPNPAIIPDTTINISKSVQIPLENLVGWGLYVGVAWLILDPLAPNWEIEQASFPDRYYHLSLKMKRVYVGGAGEARVVFHRRARELMLENGFDRYAVVEYTERLDSSVLGSQRVAQGVIQLSRN